MDTRNEIRDFPTSRRAKLNAADVGLPDYGTRRVPGLRREEVAVLAGASSTGRGQQPVSCPGKVAVRNGR